MSLQSISAAFMPLTDSIILIAAAELGFAEQEGITLKLTRETSWANVRDRMAVGHFDVAHMLAPMPIAFNLGLSPLSMNVIAPFALGLGGNAVTVSAKLFADMSAFGPLDGYDPARAGAALKSAIASSKSGRRPVFAVVHPHSGHNFELRYWLESCGIVPGQDVEIVIVPPPLMPDALASGRLDGYCVGEPWNSVAVAAGHGAMATVKAAVWRSSPEKVLGVSCDWAKQHPDVLAGLLRALFRAAEFCGTKNNYVQLAELLAKPQFIGVDSRLIVKALSGEFNSAAGQTVEDFFEPYARAATFPWQSHALWFYTQMVRWRQVAHTPENVIVALNSYRPDIYRSALVQFDVPVPQTNVKTEGLLKMPTLQDGLLLGPDGFFDGYDFDPEKLEDYIMHQTA